MATAGAETQPEVPEQAGDEPQAVQAAEQQPASAVEPEPLDTNEGKWDSAAAAEAEAQPGAIQPGVTSLVQDARPEQTQPE